MHNPARREEPSHAIHRFPPAMSTPKSRKVDENYTLLRSCRCKESVNGAKTIQKLTKKGANFPIRAYTLLCATPPF